MPAPETIATTTALALMVALATPLTTVRKADASPRVYPDAAAILAEPLASPYRVHVATMGEVTLTLGGARTDRGGHELDLFLEVPVVAEADGHVRVLIDHDDARVMVWVDTDDLAWSIVRPVRISGRGDTGVWLATGAPVDVTPAKRRRTVVYRDRTLEVRGTVDADALAKVFPVSAAPDTTYDTNAPDLRATPGGVLLYRHPLMVDIVATRGAWTLVEHRSRYLRIRGWVATTRLSDDLVGISGTGSGSAIGMSHTEQVAIPTGTCLFDATDGALAGIELAPQRRYVARHDGDWWQVYVATPWGTVLTWAHALGPDPTGAPTWERCAPPSSPAGSAMHDDRGLTSGATPAQRGTAEPSAPRSVAHPRHRHRGCGTARGKLP